MSLRGVISSLSTGTYTVTRTAAGTYDGNGRYTPGAVTSFGIVAVEEPIGGKLEDVPEGQHDDEQRLIITETLLRGQRAGEPDVVTIDGEPWRVEHVDVCKSFGAVHYESTVSRVKRSA